LLATLAVACVMVRPAAAQQPSPAPVQPPAASAARPFEILDNSFLVEEAFNQERGVFQSIATFLRTGEGWAFGFTQEWPLRSQRHQVSYTVPALGADGTSGIGDVLINYRLQALTEGPGRPAFSPRVSVILPSGNADRGTGDGVVGWQANLPFSKQAGDFYLHANAGLTVLPRRPAAPGAHVTLASPSLGASLIWRMRPMLNVLVEHAALWLEQVDDGGATSRTVFYTLSPGVRGGWNAGDAQIIVGAAVPITWGRDRVEAGGFLYFSYEVPFRR
jgi:hypothetical protein